MRNICKFILSFVFTLMAVQMMAQNDSTAFHTYLYNKEYNVFMNIDFNHHNVNIPEHELYGPVAGYLGIKTSTFYWIILSAEVKGKTARLEMVNDYGSEDLVASLTQVNDSVYKLTQEKGSSIKLPHKNKWMKLPSTLLFNRK